MRGATIRITIDGQANDGELDEGDNVLDDLETLVGGDASDEFSAGPGDNTLIGRGGDDTLNGGDGEDRFLEVTASAGADVMNGGSGTDSVDYSERESDLTISLCVADGCARGRCDCPNDDGQPDELDALVNIEDAFAGRGRRPVVRLDRRQLLQRGRRRRHAGGRSRRRRALRAMKATTRWSGATVKTCSTASRVTTASTAAPVKATFACAWRWNPCRPASSSEPRQSPARALRSACSRDRLRRGGGRA